jgi:hypothetical protein
MHFSKMHEIQVKFPHQLSVTNFGIFKLLKSLLKDAVLCLLNGKINYITEIIYKLSYL